MLQLYFIDHCGRPHWSFATTRWVQIGWIWPNHCLKAGSTHMAVLVMHWTHYCDVIMGAVASQIISLTIVYWTVYSDADQRKHQSSASLAIVWGIHRGPVNSPRKWPVKRKMLPFADVIMNITVKRLARHMNGLPTHRFHQNFPDSMIGWPNVGPTSVLSTWRRPTVSPAYIPSLGYNV